MDANAVADAALEAAKDRDAGGYLSQGRCPFLLHTVHGRLLCCAEDADGRALWTRALQEIGNLPGKFCVCVCVCV